MRLHILTLALDAMPFLPAQFYTLNSLTVPFVWHVVEGAAMNNGSTSWCKPQPPRLSRDGTTEFLHGIRNHPNVRLYQRQQWDSKDSMVNAALETIKEPAILFQIDADEQWTASQLQAAMIYFKSSPTVASMRFRCRYFLGPNIIATGENAYGNRDGEWLRAWRFTPGDTFVKHEPPVLRQQFKGIQWTPLETHNLGLVFNHQAYLLASQLRFKEAYYGYPDALKHWQRLQANKEWPVLNLRDWLPWVGDGAGADLLHKP